MASRLKAAKFEEIEGVWEAELLKDMLTSSALPPEVAAYSVFDLFNGRDLMGNLIKVRLINSDTSEVYLRTVKVKSFISKNN